MSKVGFIGIGVMGLPMARNLILGGHNVRVFDINPDALETMRQNGAELATSAKHAATAADFVITMLPNSEHVDAALFGPDGAAEMLGDHALIIDMSTVLPRMFDRMARRLEAKGKHIIDAPVGRTSKQAAEGTLLIMVGGEAEEVERARPLFECMGDTIIHCGPRGAGMRTKLVNNYLSIASNVLLAETLTFAECAGLDRELVIDVLMGTTAGQGHLGTTYPAKVLAGDLDPGFMIDLAHKDLGLALQMGVDAKMSLPMGAVAHEIYALAQNQGRGRQDWTSIYPAVREICGLDETLEN